MSSWLRDYESRKNLKYGKESAWQSSKFDTSLPWYELQQEPVPELGCNYGQACNKLKQAWRKFSTARYKGEYTRDLAWEITQIVDALGLEKNASFPELEGQTPDDEEIDQELSYEELQARREEQLENDQLANINDDDWSSNDSDDWNVSDNSDDNSDIWPD